MVINQGDVYWIDLGAPSGSGPGFRRPYVVIQNNFLNHSSINTIIVCALTTNLRRTNALGNVRLKQGEADLFKESVVVVSQLFTVDKSDLDDYVGTLSAERVLEILEGIKQITNPREIEQ